MNSELARARQNLADAEAALAHGSNPYAEQNVATHRARVARFEVSQTPARPTPTAPAAATVAPSVAVAAAPKPAPAITGTREERLRRLAKALGASERELARAIASGTTPDAFALEIMDLRDPDAVAARIMNSDKPVATKAAPEVEETAQRILNA